jgi:hypothetical protein
MKVKLKIKKVREFILNSCIGCMFDDREGIPCTAPPYLKEDCTSGCIIYKIKGSSPWK